MKAILMSIKPKHCANIFNGKKSKEVRKRFPLNYRGWMYIYCTKDKKNYLVEEKQYKDYSIKEYELETKKEIEGVSPQRILNGKVVARFYVDNVEEIKYQEEETEDSKLFNKLTCLSNEELDNYLHKKKGYAIHISQLEIFDKPKELIEFYPYFVSVDKYIKYFKELDVDIMPSTGNQVKFEKIREKTIELIEFECLGTVGCGEACYVSYSFLKEKVKENLKDFELTRAPQSYCYIEVSL